MRWQCPAFALAVSSMAHLHWSYRDYSHCIDPEPWQQLDLLLPAFRVQNDGPDSPARARAALLTQEYPLVNGGVGELYVGDCK